MVGIGKPQRVGYFRNILFGIGQESARTCQFPEDAVVHQRNSDPAGKEIGEISGAHIALFCELFQGKFFMQMGVDIAEELKKQITGFGMLTLDGGKEWQDQQTEEGLGFKYGGRPQIRIG